jgi:enediyne biosynthesis protein E4
MINRVLHMVLFKKQQIFTLLLVVVLLYTSGCKQSSNLPPAFEVLEQSKTGIDFVNQLKPTGAFNMFKYMYFYNGAGVGAAITNYT